MTTTQYACMDEDESYIESEIMFYFTNEIALLQFLGQFEILSTKFVDFWLGFTIQQQCRQ